MNPQQDHWRAGGARLPDRTPFVRVGKSQTEQVRCVKLDGFSDQYVLFRIQTTVTRSSGLLVMVPARLGHAPVCVFAASLSLHHSH